MNKYSPRIHEGNVLAPVKTRGKTRALIGGGLESYLLALPNKFLLKY